MTTNDALTGAETKPGVSGPDPRKDAPGVIIFPPLLYAGTLLFGLLLHFFYPLHLTSGKLLRFAGAIIAVASGFTAQWGARTMRRAGTNVLPGKPTLTIVTEGPFRFTRNPLYLANAVFYLGLTLIFNTAWPLFLWVPMLCVVHWGIIRREERYLEAKFGEAYLVYKARVPRWL
jgi:protein-S-isoprenylcysteine O-methyltransferase Ste14